MYSEKIKTYSDMFPNETKRAIKGLGNEVRYAILAYLLERKEASFSDITEELGLDNSSFRAHVKKLISGGLVENFIKHGEIREKYSYYRITPYGYSFLNHLYRSALPTEKTTEEFRRCFP